MDKTKQTQSAGDNATQMQAGTIQNNYYITGIDEARARGICKEECAIAMQDWTSEAISIANDRVNQLENRLMPKMLQHDETLKIFADPSFQITLRKAQIAAASSERESDYELLADLLLHRAEQNDNRDRRLGIAKAIEIVDQVDESALIALSLVYAVSKFTPVSVVPSEGLRALNNLYEKILSGNTLPSESGWMEHLDLLSAVRLGSRGLNTFKKCEEYFPERLSEFFVCGVKNDSEELQKIKQSFESVGLNTNCIIPHSLKPDFFRLSVSSDISKISQIILINGQPISIPLDQAKKDVMQKALDLMCTNDSGNQIIKDNFWKEWDSHPTLKIVHEWWNALPVHFEITPVGIALANAYIHGKDPSIPCLY